MLSPVQAASSQGWTHQKISVILASLLIYAAVARMIAL